MNRRAKTPNGSGRPFTSVAPMGVVKAARSLKKRLDCGKNTPPQDRARRHVGGETECFPVGKKEVKLLNASGKWGS